MRKHLSREPRAGKSTPRKEAAIANTRHQPDASKARKSKVIRDSFTMPENEYALIAEIKKRCTANGLAAKKSEVLRAAVSGFAGQSDAYIKAAIGALPAIPTGRPPKAKK